MARNKPVTFAVAVVALLVVTGSAVLLRGTSSGSPSADQYVSELDQVLTGPKTPNVVIRCGANEERHLNADNPVVSPGVPFGAHHTHEYVGNRSADAGSTDESLAAATTTCEKNDLSTYYWPVLRLTDGVGHDEHADGGGLHGNTGEVLPPKSVEIRYDGNPVSDVLPMPRFLRLITGDPSAFSNGHGPNTRARWSCSDRPDRYTTKYPLCGSATTLRSFDFGSCWDGNNTDSASHRTHVVFPLAGGMCPAKTFPIPRLHVTVGYDIPEGRPFAIDSFEEELRDPATDHGMYINAMPEDRMAELVGHLNRSR
ncbi:DUF1996 domain-containing protein [Lentzea sp. NEAU-D7]|uniref:DUF1996 domain-containing protein n=1 Tax=Lentzea sp. NEAU-D7 TaxID=2994667 RepID=UPI00224B4A39|nr:DUF1996 domain-containing protein [Lentzea sp. NEAU-D7]MCX2951963.1 DUF1996 domain-containing protein [Lentzea sp. NEAU-D7]